ncbi:gamma-glutamyl-gamma-aminobutyrate hydrolase family protein [Pseudodesulfovibrio sp. zrk46]|uniref:gamma-glutamyl-gamma-aminobutyrate hydrolase family protein n=1 Tax=Pseudodesulfovibrio sp. zrk46 TaxID=2725288 RepID=UPI001448D849|nr:gamma-glutamyl-gamma-aminobutyrate hydrolase family protein [Pseudodesulfovibrio sp. zrk46]QJB55731.1 C26 family cysteine hydrolase domain-containing family [Pseudodesulfovibrio sp. zrk46]
MARKRIGVTMRQVRVEQTDTTYDSLDTDWLPFLNDVLPDVVWVPVPNMGEAVVDWASDLGLSGVLLTGGDDWGTFPVRDQTERALCEWAKAEQLPLLGVCRGMQVLNYVMGGKLPSVRNGESEVDHVAAVHQLETPDGVLTVNSFHNGLLQEQDVAPLFLIWARSADGMVEAVRKHGGMMTGIMWHPERESTPMEHDMKLFKSIFGE